MPYPGAQPNPAQSPWAPKFNPNQSVPPELLQMLLEQMQQQQAPTFGLPNYTGPMNAVPGPLPNATPGMGELLPLLNQGGHPAHGAGSNSWMDFFTNPKSVESGRNSDFANRLSQAANSSGPQGGFPGAQNGAQQSEPQTTISATSWEDQLIQQLMALAQASGAPLDTEAMIQEATGGINKAYGAQIGSIRHQNQGARADTKQGSAQIQKMYKALSRDMKRAGKQEINQGKNLAASLQGIGQAGANEVNQSASQLLNANAASAGALGDPNIAKELNAQVEAQAGQNAGNAINSGTRQATNQMGLSGVQQRFYGGAAAGSSMEGTNRAADLFANLQDYLSGNRDKIAEIAGQRAQALASAKNSILGQVATQQGDSQQKMFDNIMAIANFKRMLEGDQASSALDAAKLAQSGQNSSDPFSKLFPKEQANNNNLLALLQNTPQYSGASDLYKQIMGSQEAQQGYIDQGHNNQFPLQGNDPALMQLIQMYAGNATPEIQQILMALLGNSNFVSNRPNFG